MSIEPRLPGTEATQDSPGLKLPISIRLAMTYVLVVLAVGAPAVLVIDRSISAGLNEHRDRELLARTRLLADYLAGAEAAAMLAAAADSGGTARARAVAQLDPLADRMAPVSGGRVILFAHDGRVVGDSDLDPGVILATRDPVTRPEVLLALTQGESLELRGRGQLAFAYAAVAFPAGEERAVVSLVEPQSEVDALIRGIRRRILLAAGSALVLGLLLSLAVGRAVSAPLRNMTHVAQQLARGSRAERLRVRPGDELGDLATALNRLSADRARTVSELESEKEQLRGVLEGMAEGVLLVGDGGRILLANAAARGALPHGEELAGRTPLEVTRSPELDQLLNSVRASGEPARGQVSLGGGARAFDAGVIPLAGAEGGLVVVLHDITDLKRLETVRREFVANISHELRTPLTAIRGFIDTLAGDPHLEPEERHRFVAAAARNAVRLSNLVDDLLTLARLDSPEFQLELVPCRVDVAVEHVLELHEAKGRGKRLVLSAELEPDLPPALADPAALEQILSNLIDNAIKYNREGGTVKVRAVRAGDQVRVAVEDSGMGIASIHLPRIFERLYRVDPGRSRAEGGTGLGLAIVKHLVLKHGGDVWVTSEPGVGSTFWFTLRLDLPLRRAGEPRVT